MMMRSVVSCSSIVVCAVLALVVMFCPSPASGGATLSAVNSTGIVHCGISEETAGFSYRDKAGRWQGFSVDFCRAVALAALGNDAKVTFRPLSPASRFPVLLAGTVDLLAHTATMTFGREAGIGVEFAGIYYYDGQAFMVPRKSKVKKVEDLKGAVICLEKGTTHQTNLEYALGSRGIPYTPLLFESLPEMTAAFFGGKCRALTADRWNLAAAAMSAPGGPNQYDIPGFSISKEPLGPVVRRGDEEWLTLVRWVLFALIEAEERGITRANVRSLQKTAKDPATRWFLDSSGSLGKSLGLKSDWVAEVIAGVGNYGEMWERSFGRENGLRIERGPNRLWSGGGLLYAPPFQ